MKKLKMFMAVLVTAILITSCSVTLPVTATSNAVGSKVGTAKATGYFHVLFFDADASIKTAAKNGGITKISTVDVKRSDILGIVTSFETIVTGE